MAANWWDRIQEWYVLGAKRCREGGRILLVNNLMTGERIISDEWTDITSKDQKLVIAVLGAEKYGDAVYETHCLYNTPHHYRWEKRQEEHVRLCLKHARKDHWVW